MTKMERLKVEQDKTLADCRRLMKAHGTCGLVRPTGFGKTYLSTKIATQYKKPLFLYPRDIVRKEFMDGIRTREPAWCKAYGLPDRITYNKLGKMWKSGELELLLKTDYDCVIYDEAHCAGASQSQQAIREMKHWLENRERLLITATPDRMDGFDVLEEFSGGIEAYRFTLNDVFEQKLMELPWYVYSLVAFAEDLEVMKKKLGEQRSKRLIGDANEVLKSIEREVANKLNAPDVIRRNLLAARPGENYYKFICFYSRQESAKYESEKVAQYFHEAFPHMQLRNVICTSTAEYGRNVLTLDGFRRVPNEIHLVHAVDQLNYGYHVPDITGIWGQRTTNSNIIFKQQCGRALSVMSDYSSVIFDMANNMHNPYLWQYNKTDDADKDVYGYEEDGTPIAALGVEWRKQREKRALDIDVHNLLVHDETAGLRELMKKFDETLSDYKVRDLVRFYRDSQLTWEHLSREFPNWSVDEMRAILVRQGVTLDD